MEATYQARPKEGLAKLNDGPAGAINDRRKLARETCDGIYISLTGGNVVISLKGRISKIWPEILLLLLLLGKNKDKDKDDVSQLFKEVMVDLSGLRVLLV
jgi:hypothetical protein